MTKEERAEAERAFWREHSANPIQGKEATFVAGYAAACEAKRAEIETKRRVNKADTATINRLFADLEQMASKLEAERARSTKFIERMRIIERHGYAPVTGSTMTISQAIAEYEAGK